MPVCLRASIADCVYVSCLSLPCSQRLGTDARLQSSEFDWIREEWTHEQIMDLIVGSGKFVHPDKVKVGSVM